MEIKRSRPRMIFATPNIVPCELWHRIESKYILYYTKIVFFPGRWVRRRRWLRAARPWWSRSRCRETPCRTSAPTSPTKRSTCAVPSTGCTCRSRTTSTNSCRRPRGTRRPASLRSRCSWNAIWTPSISESLKIGG